MKVITVLGNNSGRNAGDMAILGNLLRDISHVAPDVKFRVPTTNPAFLKRHFGHFNMDPVPLLPWFGALKNFGLPLLWSMLNTEAVLVTDNILFDRKFYNPVFNNMSSIALYAPFCRKRGIPIILYNASVGPIDFAVGAKALQKILDASPLAILRDAQTKTLFNRLKLNYPKVMVHADCALNTVPPTEQRLTEIIRKEGLFKNPNGTIGFNVNAYIDNWSMDGTLTTHNFSQSIAGAIDRVIEKLDVEVLFTVTQVMDLKVTKECVRYIKNRNRIRIVSNIDYTYEEIAALLGKVELHAGLRTHTLIFCAAMNTPMICIKSYPKSTGFMETIGQQDWMIGFEDLNVDNLTDIVSKSWELRHETRKTLKPIVDIEKEKASKSASVLIDFLRNR
jgi:polysaccharide pyruvyl transferase WcaK-like protein